MATPALDIISTAFAGFGMPHGVCDDRARTLMKCLDYAGFTVASKATVPALRALAIVPTMKPGVREVVHDGHRCRVCASSWDMGKPEQHQNWCALKGTES